MVWCVFHIFYYAERKQSSVYFLYAWVIFDIIDLSECGIYTTNNFFAFILKELVAYIH